MSGETIVRKADARWRRAALDRAGGKKGPSRQRTAIVTGHRDGTSSVRLVGFDDSVLAAIKSVTARRLTWAPVHRSWIVWSRADRNAVIQRLETLGFDIAVRP